MFEGYEFYLTKEEQEYLDNMRVFRETHNLINIIVTQRHLTDADSFSHYIMEMVAMAGAQFGQMHELKKLLSILKKKNKDIEDIARMHLLTYKLLMTTCLKELELRELPFNFEGAEKKMAEVEAETEKEILQIREMKKQNKFKVGV